jgi:hypothetical protein
VCLLYSAGELHVVEYGINDTVLALRTEHISPYLLSVAVQVTDGAVPWRGPDEGDRLASRILIMKFSV